MRDEFDNRNRSRSGSPPRGVRPDDVLEPSIFRYILRYSRPQQIFLTTVIIAYFPVQYASLELPKIIVDKAIRADGEPPFEFSLFGVGVSVGLEQIQFLLMLCLLYLLLVFVNGGVKFYINLYRGRLGERMLRRLRYQLYERVLRFPIPHFRKASQGEIIPMITQEVEPLGGFIGTAYSDPIFQGGQLLIILGFIMMQDWVLGLATIVLYPLQIYLIPRMQRKVNELGKRRVQEVRRLSDHIGETVSGVRDIHANGTVHHELARFSDRMGRIYRIRNEIFVRKYFIKFFNNFIDKLTPFFFFSIGGYLAIKGDLSIGALLAVLAAYKDIAAPWRELLLWYQQKEDARIKYEQIVVQFGPADMLPSALLDIAGADEEPPLSGPLEVESLSYEEEDGARPIESVSFTLPAGAHAAIVGDAVSGRTELGYLLARLLRPTAGRISIGGRNLASAPEPVLGRDIGFAGPTAFLQNGTIGDNILYGVKRRPVRPDAHDEQAKVLRERDIEEALMTGNSTFDYHGDWIDLDAIGAADAAAVIDRIVDVLRLVELDGDIYELGLRGRLDPAQRPQVAEQFLAARKRFRIRLQEAAAAGLVEPFDAGRYNTNATVAENLMFGAPLDRSLTADRLSKHPYVLKVLEDTGLTGDFLRIGKALTETMIEMFADLPPGHEFFDRFSFIGHEELGVYQAIATRAEAGFERLDPEERHRLLSLPFRLVAARHRLGLIDEAMQRKILTARRAFAAGLPGELADRIALFDPQAYNPAATIEDNVLFGKLAYGQAHAADRVGALLDEVLDSLGLRDDVIAVGLDSPVGVGGSRLTTVQAQKAALARALIKRPTLLVVDEATAGLDPALEARIIRRVLDSREGMGVVWILSRPAAAAAFAQVIVLKEGRVVEQGAAESLSAARGEFARLLAVG